MQQKLVLRLVHHIAHAGLPLLAKELTEQAARRRTFVIRVVYATILFLTASLFFYETLSVAGASPLAVLGRGKNMFAVLVGLQFAGIYFFMPAMTCSVITQEKERASLQLLFLTRLGPWTILFEKLLGRMVPMGCFLLLSLPLLGFAYTLGGVSREMLWKGTWLLSLATIQMGTLALMCSAFFRTTVGAFMASYLIAFLMFFGPYFLLYGRVPRGFDCSISISMWCCASCSPARRQGSCHRGLSVLHAPLFLSRHGHSRRNRNMARRCTLGNHSGHQRGLSDFGAAVCCRPCVSPAVEPVPVIIQIIRPRCVSFGKSAACRAHGDPQRRRPASGRRACRLAGNDETRAGQFALHVAHRADCRGPAVHGALLIVGHLRFDGHVDDHRADAVRGVDAGRPDHFRQIDQSRRRRTDPSNSGCAVHVPADRTRDRAPEISGRAAVDRRALGPVHDDQPVRAVVDRTALFAPPAVWVREFPVAACTWSVRRSRSEFTFPSWPGCRSGSA